MTTVDPAAMAMLCDRGLRNDSFSADELEASLSRAEHVIGDPASGVVVTVVRNGQGHIRLLVVDPGHRGRGLGAELLAAGEESLRSEGCSSIVVGADPPDFLLPGVDSDELEMVCLLEERGYVRIGAEFNMTVALADLPPDPGGWAVASSDGDRDDVAAFCAAHWPAWGEESLRALDKGTLVIGRDDAGLTGFCAWDANRAAWLGPIAVRPRERGRGLGTPLLLGALHQMASVGGYSTADIGWVGPIAFYVKRAGARMGRTFLRYRKDLTRDG